MAEGEKFEPGSIESKIIRFKRLSGSGDCSRCLGMTERRNRVDHPQGGRHQGPPRHEGSTPGMALPVAKLGEEQFVNKVGT